MLGTQSLEFLVVAIDQRGTALQFLNTLGELPILTSELLVAFAARAHLGDQRFELTGECHVEAIQQGQGPSGSD